MKPSEFLSKKLESLSDEDLKTIFDALQKVGYDEEEIWDHTHNITMEEWESGLYSELGRRGLSTL